MMRVKNSNVTKVYPVKNLSFFRDSKNITKSLEKEKYKGSS
jgi:hypothetical protein